MKKILMCSPDYYDVTYSINPWMYIKVPVNKKLAFKQWRTLKNLIENFLEIKVVVIKQKPKQPDMVFSADQGIVLGKTFIKANFTYPERQRESKYFANWFKKDGFKVKTLPSSFYFEGGDFLLWQDKILAGHGFRTNKKSIAQISKLTDKEIIPLKLVDPSLYHLDTALFPLNQDFLVYYPKAFDSSSQKTLKQAAKNLIKTSKKDAFNFVLNSLGNKKKILTRLGVNGLLPQLKKKGFQVVQTDVSEFEKAGGSIHCLTCYLN